MASLCSASFLRRQQAAPSARPQLTCRLTASEEDAEYANCTPIQDGIEQNESYAIRLPQTLSAQHADELASGDLLVIIDGASLGSNGDVQLLDDAMWVSPMF